MISKVMMQTAILATFAGTASAQEFALNYGAAITSNYISDGATQSNDNPALQGYVEGSYGLFYGGIWSSTVDFADDPEFGGDQIEFDLYAGVRPTLGDFSFDISYYRYLYDDSGDCCGEFVLVAQYPVADFGDVGVEFDYDPVENTRWGELAGALTFKEVWEVGGAIGTDFGSEEWGNDDKVAWDAGVTRGLGEIASVDLRYYDFELRPRNRRPVDLPGLLTLRARSPRGAAGSRQGRHSRRPDSRPRSRNRSHSHSRANRRGRRSPAPTDSPTCPGCPASG